MIKLKRNYTDSTQFDNGILPWGKALATSLQWLYDDDEFDDDSISEEEYDRNMLYYMDGILPIYDFMSLVTDVIYMAFRDFGEPDIKNYLNLLQDIETRKWCNNKPRLQYDGAFMILGEVSSWTTEVILWSAYLYCHMRTEFEPENERAVRADKLLYKLYAQQTCLKPELVKNTFLMKHFNETMLTLLNSITADHGKQAKNSAEGRTRDALPTIDMINQKPTLIGSIGDIIAREKFEYSSMRQVFALLDERLMDKAILVISDKWDKLEKQLSTQPKKPKEDQTFVPTGKTFRKTTKITDLQLTLIMQRLSMANKLDPDASADTWHKLFSGVNSKFTMKWNGKPGELRDFFAMLTEPLPNSKTGYVTPHYDYQKIVRSHFTDSNGNIFKSLKGQKNIPSFQPILDDCTLMLQCITEKMTDVMRMIVQEHKEELLKQGFHFNTTSAKKDDGQRVRNKL